MGHPNHHLHQGLQGALSIKATKHPGTKRRVFTAPEDPAEVQHLQGTPPARTTAATQDLRIKEETEAEAGGLALGEEATGAHSVILEDKTTQNPEHILAQLTCFPSRNQ